MHRHRPLRCDDSPAERPKRGGQQHLVARLEQDLTDDAQARGRTRHDLDEVRVQRFTMAALDVGDEGVD